MADRTYVVDFDGTLAMADLGTALCRDLAVEGWFDAFAPWQRGEISLAEAQRRAWSYFRVPQRVATAHLEHYAELRSGATEFIDRCRARGDRLVLASGGFGFYIEVLLASHLDAFAERYHNDLTFGPQGALPVFVHQGELGCEHCAVCKGLVCDREAERGADVIFIGDGHSDRCALGRASTVYAVRGKALSVRAARLGAAVVEFESFDEIP